MLLCGITLLTANVYASKSTDSDDHEELDLRHSMASTQLLDSSGEFSEPEAEAKEETVTPPQKNP